MGIYACSQYLQLKKSFLAKTCKEHFCYVTVCNEFPEIQKWKLSVKTIKILYFDKRKKLAFSVTKDIPELNSFAENISKVLIFLIITF